MDELIPISEHNGQKAVSARLLHEFLESKRDFSNWIKDRIDKYELSENQDYVLLNNFGEQTGRGGHNKVEYALTIDAAKELSMVEGNDKGKQARRYFIECERIAKESIIQLPQTYAEALRELANQAEETERLQLEKKMLSEHNEFQHTQLEQADSTIREQAPKVQYYDTTLNSKGLLTVNMVASVLGISAVKLNKLLCEWGIQYPQSGTYFLYEKQRNKGYATHKSHPYTDSNGEIKTRQHLYWTERGKEAIIKYYNTTKNYEKAEN